MTHPHVEHAKNRRTVMLAAIVEFIRENGYPPTVREIQHMCNISSTSVVSYNLNLLVSEGKLKIDKMNARGITVISDDGTITPPVIREKPVPDARAALLRWKAQLEDALKLVDTQLAVVDGVAGVFAGKEER